MKIMPINNTQVKPQFKAKFSKNDMKQFLQELKYKDVDDVPKLYTMLDIIKKQQGKIAKIDDKGYWCQIQIDGKSMNNERRYFTAFHAVEDATVNHKNTLITDTPIKRLSEEEFEAAWLKNAKKTIKDIENIFKE